jgi:hypothetical protein
LEYSDIVLPILAIDNGSDNQPFITETSLTYYTEPSILSPKAFHIKKGDLSFGMNLGSFYGIRSFPTYKKGWRIAVPYATEDTLDEYESTMYNGTGPIYYVSTKALEKFSKAYLSNISGKTIRNMVIQELLITWFRHIDWNMTIDYIMLDIIFHQIYFLKNGIL